MQKLNKQEIIKVIELLIKDEKQASVQIDHDGNGNFTACYIKLPIDKLDIKIKL